MQTKEYKNHFPEFHNGMTLCRVQSGVAIYNETELAEGIFLSYNYEGYAQLTDKNYFMGWAQDWGHKHRVFILQKVLHQRSSLVPPTSQSREQIKPFYFTPNGC